MEFPPELRYRESHEWVRVEGEEVVVGISDHAQNELGDVVYIELPEVGQELAQGEVMATIESVKAVGELYAPVSGQVIAVHTELEDELEKVNQDCYGEGWIVRLKMTKPEELKELLTAEQYQATLQ